MFYFHDKESECNKLFGSHYEMLVSMNSFMNCILNDVCSTEIRILNV